jgi:hypothetical protein
MSPIRLAIVPGYTHYNFGQGPDVARVIESRAPEMLVRDRQAVPLLE